MSLGAQTLSADTLDAASELPPTIIRGDVIRRYLVLNRIGRGGMGTVFRAKDAELERSVALKVVGGKKAGPRATARLRREARALARLNHPNIVSVFDVFEHGGHVFIAMEYVLGTTLGTWLRKTTPRWQEVLGVVLDVGRGLATAHQAGIIHRDLKPANIMLMTSSPAGVSPVKILDFGLARVAAESDPSGPDDAGSTGAETAESLSVDLTQPGLVLGTPRYMAPEQHRGEPASDRSDQYSLCVTAWEALAGTCPFPSPEYAHLVALKLGGAPEHPAGTGVPEYVWSALRRGLDPRPQNRWANIDELLAALSGRGRRWRRWLAGAGVGCAAAAGLAGLGASEQPADCEEAARGLDQRWADQRKDVRAGLEASSLPFSSDTAARVQQQLDSYAGDWSTAWRSQCIGPSAPLHDRKMACLRRLRDKFVVSADALTGQLTEEAVTRAVGMVHALRPVRACMNAETVAELGPQPRTGDAARIDEALHLEATQAEVVGRMGDYRLSRTLLAEVLRRAEKEGSPALVADLQFDHASALRRLGQTDEAIAEFERSFTTASQVAYDKRAFSAAGQLAFVHTTDKRDFVAADRWLRHAEALLERGGLAPMSVATYEQHRALFHQLQGHHDEALEHHTRALALYRKHAGSTNGNVASVLNNIGILHWRKGDYQKAAWYYGESLGLKEQLYGPNHPALAGSLNNTAIALHDAGQLEKSVALHQRTIRLKVQNLGPDSPRVATSLSNLGNVLIVLGRHDEARESFERALAILNAAEPGGSSSIFPLQGLGRVLLEQGEPDRARSPLERSIALAETHEDPLELAEGRFELARTLVALGEDRDYARSLAQDARITCAAAGPRYADEVERIDAWLGQL